MKDDGATGLSVRGVRELQFAILSVLSAFLDAAFVLIQVLCLCLHGILKTLCT